MEYQWNYAMITLCCQMRRVYRISVSWVNCYICVPYTYTDQVYAHNRCGRNTIGSNGEAKTKPAIINISRCPCCSKKKCRGAVYLRCFCSSNSDRCGLIVTCIIVHLQHGCDLIGGSTRHIGLDLYLNHNTRDGGSRWNGKTESCRFYHLAAMKWRQTQRY